MTLTDSIGGRSNLSAPVGTPQTVIEVQRLRDRVAALERALAKLQAQVDAL